MTVLQISQMFLGVAVCATLVLYKMEGKPCDNDNNNLAAGIIMYASYAALFVVFALERYLPASMRLSVPTKGKKA